jgi:hypothetical protein
MDRQSPTAKPLHSPRSILKAWIASSRQIEEKALSICTKRLPSAHPNITFAIPVKLGHEMRKPPSSSEKDSGSLDRNLAYISANYAILLRAVEHEEIMIPVQMNILGSHPLGLCSWKDGARALPGSRSQAGAGHSWNTFNVFELGDVFRNSLRNSPLLCISDARLLLFKRKEDLLAIDTVYPQDEDQFIPRAYAVE